MNNQLEIFEQALQYLQKGYSIIPVGLDKRPLIQWKKYQTTKTTEEELSQWFKQFPNMNIAIVTGKISNLTVIDFDTKSNRVNELLQKFPPTYMVKTPSGGAHLYYKYEPGHTVSANAYPDLPYVDVRGDSGFVVAPPSHTSVGEYKVIQDIPIESFPSYLFPKQKAKKSLTQMTTANKGNRNDTLASFSGLLLQSAPEDTWESEVYPAVQRANLSYNPILPEKEVRTVFDSITKKERQRRADLVTSPVIVDGKETGEKMAIAKSRSGIPFMNMSNVVAILEAHPDFREKIRYNTFKHEIEIDGVPIEDNDTIRLQHILQTKFGLHSVNKDSVYSALTHCAYHNKYDEAQEWLTSLKWDGQHRLFTWLSSATGVEDNEYHRGIGTQWWLQIANRIMNPGCIADYMLVIIGAQGTGKTSLFRIIGGEWYKTFTGGIEGKDFFLQMRGAILMDLDEGATMYKSEVIKLKSVITQTTDEFRTPYDRLPKKFPRRFVFSMSTNDVEPFRDVTGNRRYWAVDIKQMVNFKWLEDNREQLFAEALYWLQNKSREIPEVPEDEVKRIAEEHLPEDSWSEFVISEVRKSYDYCKGDPNYSTTISEVFQSIFKNETLIKLDRRIEMRIGTILRKDLGLEKLARMVDGERKNRWYIMSEKLKELQEKNVTKTIEPIEMF